jgi:hypothetical protein
MDAGAANRAAAPQGGTAVSRMFNYSSIADHILTVVVALLVAMFAVVMFFHPA